MNSKKKFFCIKILVFLLIIIFSFNFYSVSFALENIELKNAQHFNSTYVLKAQMLYCPEPNLLKRNGLWWHVQNIWKSYNQSFAEEIKEFIGAQWIGVEVGKIICLYKGKEKLDFPVTLETVRPVLILEPTGYDWKPAEYGYKKCGSKNVKNCPFIQKKKPKIIDVYQEIKYQIEIIEEEGY